MFLAPLPLFRIEHHEVDRPVSSSVWRLHGYAVDHVGERDLARHRRWMIGWYADPNWPRPCGLDLSPLLTDSTSTVRDLVTLAVAALFVLK